MTYSNLNLIFCFFNLNVSRLCLHVFSSHFLYTFTSKRRLFGRSSNEINCKHLPVQVLSLSKDPAQHLLNRLWSVFSIFCYFYLNLICIDWCWEKNWPPFWIFKWFAFFLKIAQIIFMTHYLCQIIFKVGVKSTFFISLIHMHVSFSL